MAQEKSQCCRWRRRTHPSRLWRALAEQGDPDAQYALGGMYANPDGPVTRDTVEATRWFRLAAQGQVPAASNLAIDTKPRATKNQGMPAAPARRSGAGVRTVHSPNDSTGERLIRTPARRKRRRHGC